MFAYLRDRSFLRATALMTGTMVGVGMFGIPFAFMKSGFWVGAAWLAVLAVVTVLYNLAFAELTLRTQGTHQISGYASIWLGPWARRLSFFALVLSGYGTLLAYLIIAGQFLHTILSQYIAINPDWYGVVFAVTWSLVAMVRLRTVAAVDLFVMAAFGVIVAVMVAFGITHVDPLNFQGFTWHYWFLPYGIIMFALSGANAVPLQREFLAGRERLLRPAIITAVILVSILYLVFAATVVGVSGSMTTPDAIAGLYGILGPGIIVLGSLFGVVTISMSFLMMSAALYETFRVDYHLRTLGAWLLIIVPPILLFLSGLRNFIDVISLVGSVAVGVLAVIILLAYVKARRFSMRAPEWTLPLGRVGAWVLAAVFIAGIAHTLIFR